MSPSPRLQAPAILATLALAATGCRTVGEAHYVYQDAQYGVVAIPETASRWPRDDRRQAERLMAEHFPEGYQIVRAEEVVEGSRTLTSNGTTSAELAPSLHSDVVALGKLGHTTTSTQADTLKLKEYRIIYRRAPAPAPSRFAPEPTATPPLYVDANAAERRSLATPPSATASNTAEPKPPA